MKNAARNLNRNVLVGLWLIFSSMMISQNTFAFVVEVLSAEVDSAEENLIVKVAHSGGCQKHEYKLNMKGCAESYPVQCRAEIETLTMDPCQAMISGTAVFNFKKLGLNTDYYSNGSLLIKGANGSSAQTQFPEFDKTPSTIPPVTPGPPSALPGKIGSAKNIRCVTHTDSDLEIDGEVMNLTTVSGQTSKYGIIDTMVRVLESIPSIFQRTYSLDDGRKVVIEMRDGEKVGSGYFIRLGGGTSPKFKSCLEGR